MDESKRNYKMIMNIKGTTKITGVFGDPVEHSLSPVFQNEAFQALKMDYVYIPFLVKKENLKKAVDGIKALNIRGINITIPHKSSVIKYLDEIDENVEILGAANTILNEDGFLKGFNTDGKGFSMSLNKDGGFVSKGKKVLILGAGGTAYAIAGQLIREDISRLVVCNRTNEKAILLKKHLKKVFPHFSVETIDFEKRRHKEFLKDVDLLINATACGMKEGNEPIISKEVLHKDLFVYDVVYNRKTELIDMAQTQGLKYLNGLSMLIYQGAVSFEIWTGLKAPVEIMKKYVSSKLQ